MSRRYIRRGNDSLVLLPSVVRHIRNQHVSRETGRISGDGFRPRPPREEYEISAARLFHPRYAKLSIDEQLKRIYLNDMGFRDPGAREEFVRIFDSELEALGFTVADDGSTRNPTHVSVSGEFNEEQIRGLVEITNGRSRRYRVRDFIN